MEHLALYQDKTTSLLLLLFEKVNFKVRNKIGRPAPDLTQRIDNLTGLR